MAIASLANPATRKLRFEDVERLRLMMTAEEVVQQIGKPEQKTTDKAGGLSKEIWIYFDGDKSHTQRVTLTFDHDSNKLIDKLYIPREDEAEYSFDKLIAKKISTNKFERIVPKICGENHYEKDEIWIDESSANIIRSNRKTKEVASIGWVSQSEIKAFKESLTGKCTDSEK